MSEKKISFAVVRRLPRYYRYLSDLLDKNITRISSRELSQKMNVTASQIRQDFNNFGGFGQQGYGYNVEYLKNEIGKILGLDQSYNTIILGAGNLGQALANYAGFPKRGFFVVGIFDVDDNIIGKQIGNITVKNIDTLEEFIENNPVDIAVLALPRLVAPSVAKKLSDLGVKSFWNFAATDLELPEDCLCENVHLAESLMRLSYNIANKP